MNAEGYALKPAPESEPTHAYGDTLEAWSEALDRWEEMLGDSKDERTLLEYMDAMMVGDRYLREGTPEQRYEVLSRLVGLHGYVLKPAWVGQRKH